MAKMYHTNLSTWHGCRWEDGGYMSKGGYDKIFRKLQEANAEILNLRSKLIECGQEILELRKTGRTTSATTGGSAIDPPLDTDEPQREWQQPLNRIDSIHLLTGLVGTFLALVVPTVWQKVPGLLLMCFGFAYFVWFSQITHRLNKWLRFAIIVVILSGINYTVVPQLIDQWRTDHMQSELAFNANAPGIAYPDGDHYGIKWSKGFAEVRLTAISKGTIPYSKYESFSVDGRQGGCNCRDGSISTRNLKDV